ncbi:frizzled and smoothened-like protein [Tieghemostelium lacteum]|uniref:Frizzled and smoothened-like protein n=1 Tax=Tieghemostelium lacteum TaxID=361077 RepID=A0A151ZSF8_TIELA|nr:frizzled and smoothened-like protein [Tieghemostelium lacteum]|eukprot:KYQ96933.1 frizzled and smoothened-like protein [Tieghemostelium lacteum]
MIKTNSSSDFMMILYFIGLLLVSSNIVYATIDIDAKCVPIDQTSPCALILPYTEFYLNSTDSQDINKGYADTLMGYKEFLQDCANPMFKLICLTLYPSCSEITNTTPDLTLPIYPCKSVCSTIYAQCGTFINMAITNFTCDQVDANGQSEYPVSSNFYDLSNWGGSTNQSIQCTDGSQVKDLPTNTGVCMSPLVYVEPDMRKKQNYYFITDECAIPCPFDVFTPEEYQKFRTTKIIIYALSFSSSIYLFFVYAILPNRHTNRMEIISSFALGGIMVSISYYMEFAASSKTFDNFVCTDDPGRYTFQSDPKCGFNAFFFHFGLLTSNSIVSWSIPTICTIAPFAGQKFGAALGSSGCWILAGNKTAWPFLCFYIPIYICILIAFYFLAFSVKRVIQTYHLVPNKRIVLFNVRMIIFMVWVCFSITFGCFNNFYLDAKSKQFIQSVADYFTCIASGGSNCQVSFPFGTFRLLNIIATSSTGFAGFLGLGVDDTPRLWSESTKVHFIAMLIKKTSLYNYLILKLGSGKNTESTNSNSNSGGNISSGYSLSQQTTQPISRKETRREKRKTQLLSNSTSTTSATIEMDTFNSNSTLESSNVILTQTTTLSTTGDTTTSTTSPTESTNITVFESTNTTTPIIETANNELLLNPNNIVGDENDDSKPTITQQPENETKNIDEIKTEEEIEKEVDTENEDEEKEEIIIEENLNNNTNGNNNNNDNQSNNREFRIIYE